MLTQQRVRELLDFSPETGIFRWKIKAASNTVIGSIAGRTNITGYREIGIDKRLYGAHRIAWLYIHGSFPIGVIDHFNGKVDDNRISNLRDVSYGENLHNQSRAHGKNNFLGVSWQKSRNKWRADICLNGKQKLIGRFDSENDARLAYISAKKQMHIPGRLSWPELLDK